MGTLKTELVVERCLICTPIGKDADLLLETFRREDIAAAAYPKLELLADSFDPSVDLVIIVAEEALVPTAVTRLHQRLSEQPEWSETPIILLAPAGQRVSERADRLLELFRGKGGITMLERPLRVQTLLSTVCAALRARYRQYQIRDLLIQHENDVQSLRQAKDILERKVQERTAELTTTNAELRREIEERTRAEEALRELSQRTLQLQDEERRRIARELHDTVGQALAVTVMSLSALASRLPDEAQPALEEIRSQLDGCAKDVRTISHLLHPPLLDEIGLSSALKWYTEEFSRRSRINVDLEMPPETGRMKSEVETAIFRIVQENLTNIHRHSGARNARILLQSDGALTRMVISDDGCGIAQARLELIRAGQSGVGTAGMRERVKQLNGTFQIESDDRGTRVQVEIPRIS